MNDNSGEDLSLLNKKVDTILGLLSKNEGAKGIPTEEMYREQKREETRSRRLNQKKRTYQAIPIVIDGLTNDGKKQIDKIFKKTDALPLKGLTGQKSGLFGRIMALVVALAGLVIGMFLGVLDQVKKIAGLVKNFFTNFRKILSNIFNLIKQSKIYKMIEGLFLTLKSKFLSILKFIGELDIVKAIKIIFTSISTSLKGKFNFILQFFKAIGEKLKPIKDFFGKLKSINFSKFLNLKTIVELVSKLTGLGKIFTKALALGRLLGKFLLPLLAVFEVLVGTFQAFTDPKLKDKSNLQKIITGVLKGILNIFDIFEIIGLNIVSFPEIRDRVDKIFSSFKDGILKGILDVVNQIASFIVGIPIKILGWIVGFFNKDLGNQITQFGVDLDILRAVKNFFKGVGTWIGGVFDSIVNFFTSIPEAFGGLVDNVKKGLSALGDKISNTITDILNWIGETLSFKNIAKFVKTKLGFGDEEDKKTKVPKPVGDFMDSDDRVLFSGQEAYSFDDNDQIMALKQGGPIDNILGSRDAETSSSVNDLTVIVKDLNNTIQTYFKAAASLQQSEIKLMSENMELLRDIRDKSGSKSNVVVQNTANNTSFNDKPSSTRDYRKDLADRYY